MHELCGVPILIIADDDISGKALAAALESLNMLPVWSSGRVQAAECVRSTFFPIIILDSQQEDPDTLEMLRDLRKDVRYQLARILFITSQDNIRILPDYLRSGIDDYIVKPVLKEVLASRLYILWREQQRWMSVQVKGSKSGSENNGIAEAEVAYSDKLLLQRRYLNSLADNISAGVLLLDSELRVVEYNKLLKSWLPVLAAGTVYSELKKRLWCNSQPDSCPVYKCLQNNNSQSSICEVTIGEEEKVFKVLVLPVRAESGEIRNLLLLFNDITVETFADDKSLTELQSGTLSAVHDFCGLLGKSKVMLEMYQQLKLMSQSRDIVLLQGETGTGKELCAKALHKLSSWRSEPLLSVNCGSLPESILESELFGHTRGAFTGAAGNKAGLFVAAGRGTIFLDEIETATPHTQVALLRVLDQMEVMPIGGRIANKIYARIIVASNRNLEEMVMGSEFRDDLYYRICGRTINLPPLREHIDDLEELTEYFFARDCKNRVKRSFSPRSLELLKKYSWPGNVRELRNLINALIFSSVKPLIHPADLPVQYHNLSDTTLPTLAEHEKGLLEAALCHTSWNKSDTAKLLDISRNTVYSLIKKHGLDR